MRLQIGTSTHEDVQAAVELAVSRALEGCHAPALALVFSTSDYSAESVAVAAARSLEGIHWVGVTTPAILVGADVVTHGIAVGVLDGEGVRARVGAEGPMSLDARDAGRRAAREALTDMPLPPSDRSRAMLLFGDADSGDASEMLHGALGVAGSGIAWCGGGTGSLVAGAHAALYAKGRALRDHAVAVTLDCPARIGVGIKHGWEPTGSPAMVTRAHGRAVQRLEHRPAFEIYQAAAEERGQELDARGFASFAMSHPLGIPQVDGEYLIRDPLSVDDAGALHFLASVPDGALVRVMQGTKAMLVEAARAAASMARGDAGGEIGGALVFDCVSRYLMLGDGLRDELAACQSALGSRVPVLGCLTFGEVGAFGSRMPQFHNKTMVVLALPA